MPARAAAHARRVEAQTCVLRVHRPWPIVPAPAWAVPTVHNRRVRVGIADHLGWAVVIAASADHEVVDRRRIELVEPGLPSMPMHSEGKRLDVAATAALVAEVRASVARAGSAAFDTLATALPLPIVSLSLHSWPPDFPDDVAVLRRVPWEAPRRRRHVPPGARRAGPRTWLGRAPLRREGRRRAGGPAAGRAGRRGPGGSARPARAALDEGSSDGARRDGRRRLTA